MVYKTGKRLKDERINGQRVMFVRDAFGKVYASTPSKSKFVIANTKEEAIRRVRRKL